MRWNLLEKKGKGELRTLQEGQTRSEPQGKNKIAKQLALQEQVGQLGTHQTLGEMRYQSLCVCVCVSQTHRERFKSVFRETGFKDISKRIGEDLKSET